MDDTVKSPFCRHVRSKKYYFLDAMPMAADDLLDASNFCWCDRTMQAVGPDGDRVHPEYCHATRSCYVSEFDGGQP